jgi:hypothetical protein
MFEYIAKKRDPISIVFYCGFVPFGLFWALHQSLVAGFLLQAYIVTTAVFVLDPLQMQPQNAKQRWFWKIMLRGGIAVHPLFLAGMWYLDVTHPVFVAGTGTVFFDGFVASVIEIVVLGTIVKRFRPLEHAEPTSETYLNTK